MTVLPQLMMPGGVTGTIAPFISIITSSETESASAATSFTRSNVNIGAAPTGGKRRFVFCVGQGTDGNSQQADFTSGCYIDNSFLITEVVRNTSSYEAFGAVYYKEVPTGTTASCRVSWTGTVSQHNLAVISILTGPGGFDVYDTDWEPQIGNSTSMTEFQNVVEGGALIGGAVVKSGNITATGVTTRHTASPGTAWMETYYDTDMAVETGRPIEAAKSQSTAGMLLICSLRPL